MKIYTKTGDAGDTGCLRRRVQKDDPRVEAYGDVDELNAVIGMARAVEPLPRVDEVLVQCSAIYSASAPFSPRPTSRRCTITCRRRTSTSGRIKDLEHAIDECEKELER